MTAPARTRGVTILELVIGIGISAIVLAGSLLLLQQQQHALQAGNQDRILQETARMALGHISANLRAAGFGVDPALVLGFGSQSNVRMERAPGVTFNTTSLQCADANRVTCRDRIDGPDEIVFLSRDPEFGHVLRAAATAGSTALTIQGPLNTPLYPGQILQVACYSNPMTWAYLQVSSLVSPTSTDTVSVPITASANSTFPTQNPLLGDTCFSKVALGPPTTIDTTYYANLQLDAKVFKVDRYRYYVASYQDPLSGTSRPYLMLDQGLSDAGGNAMVSVVTPDVEDVQFAYVFPNSPDTAHQLVGTTAGTAIPAGATGIDLAPVDGFVVYSDPVAPVAAPTRLTHHPANIRLVKVSLVVRAPAPDLRWTFPGNDQIPAALNRPAQAGPAHYRRLLVETSVPLRNLDAQLPYFPTYGFASDQQNPGGG